MTRKVRWMIWPPRRSQDTVLLGVSDQLHRLPATLRSRCSILTFTVPPRDMARLVRPLVTALGVESVALASGGSLGGMVTLEWAASFPELTRAAVVFAAPAAHTAHAIGLNHVQRQALRLGEANGAAVYPGRGR